MYSPSNFIAPFTSTSKTVRILYPDGRISFTLVVCNYQKSSVSGNTLNIVLEDSTKEYKLPFSTEQNARQALISLKQAVDSLKVNCNSEIFSNIPTEIVETLDIPSLNTLSTLSAIPLTLTPSKTLLFINGKEEDSLGATPSFTLTGATITWDSINAGYDLEVDDEVVAKYFI